MTKNVTFSPRTPILGNMSDDFESKEMDETPARDPFCRSNPRSFINLIPDGMAAHILTAHQARPEFFGLTERELYKKLRSLGKTPDPTDNRLRLQFWQQYDASQASGKMLKINMIAVVQGICQPNFFYERYLRQPEKVAWLVTMPVDYDTYLKEALQFGMEQLREVLELDHTLPNGKIDVKLLELKAKITFALDARKNGGVIQRVEQKQMNLNISTSDKAVAQAALGGTMEDMEKRLRQLEREEKKLLSHKGEIDSERTEKEVASE